MRCGASAYANGECRCAFCTEAHRDRMRKRKRERAELTRRNGGVAPVAKHNASTYSNWGCRCASCSADHHIKMAAAWTKRKAARAATAAEPESETP